MSPAKSIDPSNGSFTTTTTRKRKSDASSAKFTNGPGGDPSDGPRPTKVMKKTTSGGHESPSKHSSRKQSEEKQGFTFEEVKGMLENILTMDKKLLDSSVNVGVKNIDYSNCVVPGHQEEDCKQLVDKLVHSTRRIRTLQEVLQEIKTSLNKRTYTNIIKLGDKPKRPPSAYLMYHQKRFKELQEQGETLAAEVAKIVSEEWKTLSDHERMKYLKQHERELKAYEENIERLGYNKVKKPIRPKSAKAMYVNSKMAERANRLPKDKAKLDKLKKNLEEEYDQADSNIKEYWISLHKSETQLYEQARAKFVEDNPHLDPTDIIKPRIAKSKISPPDGPRNALKFYLEKKIHEGLEGQELKEKEARLREKFDKLSDKKLLKYIKKALRDKDRYDAELKEFVEQHPDHKVPTHKSNVTKKEWQLYQKLAEGRPVQPAPTPYLHFCQSHIKNLDGLDQAPTKRLQEASKAWKELTIREIARVQDDHLDCIKKYIEDMEAWLAVQDHERVKQLFAEDPKCKPEYWRKRIPKVQKSNAKNLVQGVKGATKDLVQGEKGATKNGPNKRAAVSNSKESSSDYNSD